MANRPNILYIHSHDTGRHIQPYGHAVPTPNLQRLAEEGVLFRQNFTINPTCSPSRACLLTGQYAHQNGMLGLAHRGFSLYDYKRHLLHTLRDQAGYHSALCGIQHIAHGEDCARVVIGYDEVIDSGRAERAEWATATADWLENAPETPWFLSVGFFETHRGFPPASEIEDERYCLPPAPLPDTPETRRDMAEFKASARILDEQMGLIFDTLRKTGQMDNTLIVCTTDHGIAFPRMKCHLHDSGTGVMLIVRGPGGFTGGKVVDAMTTHMDIFPTICDILGIDHPDWLEGESLVPLVTGEKDAIHDEVCTEVNYHAAYEPMRSVRTARWKYIKRFDGREKPVYPNCDGGLSKDVWVDGEAWFPVDEEQLYDLLVDPNEARNLAADPACASVLEEMRGRMTRWMERTDDPLLSGAVAAPTGAVVNDVDGMSPHEELTTIE